MDAINFDRDIQYTFALCKLTFILRGHLDTFDHTLGAFDDDDWMCAADGCNHNDIEKRIWKTCDLNQFNFYNLLVKTNRLNSSKNATFNWNYYFGLLLAFKISAS